jgi:hypothetical protein
MVCRHAVANESPLLGQIFSIKKAGGLATRRLLDWQYQPLTP